jgi:hypothetical protein
MAKVKKVTLVFDEASLEDVASFHVYYDTAEINDASPFVNIPVVADLLVYDVEFPTLVPVLDGNYNLGVCAVDAVGNEGDMDVITYFFDFTPPKAKPVWRR